MGKIAHLENLNLNSDSRVPFSTATSMGGRVQGSSILSHEFSSKSKGNSRKRNTTHTKLGNFFGGIFVCSKKTQVIDSTPQKIVIGSERY